METKPRVKSTAPPTAAAARPRQADAARAGAPLRVAVGAIFTECNHLGGAPIDRSWYERYELLRGEELLAGATGAVAGMLQVLRERRLSPVPLLYASTCSGGPLTRDTYEELKGELLQRLRAALPVNGVLLPLHGAAAAEHVGDPEGDLIGAVRALVGAATPVVATLDLHAHVTAAMVRGADALVAWETYPHRDAVATGERAARLLADAMAGRCRPAMAMAKVPVVTGAINGSTEGAGPFADLMRRAKALEAAAGVLSTSMFLVHPYLDLPDLGSGALVITDGDPQRAARLAAALAEEYWQRRAELEPQVHTPEQAVAAGLQVEGTVLLVETADCCGGGAAGDSAASLKALLGAVLPGPALVPVVDPAAARACRDAGAGNAVTVAVGHRLDPQWGRPVTVTGHVLRLSDGRFRYRGGIWDGVEGAMGPSAVLAVPARGGPGAVHLLLATHATYDWADEQFRCVGLDPAAAKFIVAKNPMNYHLAYSPIAAATYVLDTPGPTPATVRSVPFRNLRRPWFPADPDIPNLRPTLLT